MDGRSGRDVWSGPRKSLNHRGHRVHRGTRLQRELLVEWLRTSVMRFCVALIFPAVLSAVILSGVCVFSQDSPSDSKPPVASRPAALVSPPVDLKPDASGAVPPEQI